MLVGSAPWSKAVLVLAVLAVGIVLRVHDYGAWQDNRELHFFEDEPLLLNGDGYHYLRLARDLRDGAYQPIDALRTVPENPPRPTLPPLLSVLTVALSSLSTLSLPWAAAVLPVLLSVSLALPVLALFRLLRLPFLAALPAALAAIASRLHVDRTTLGFYDTDCLIVFFALSASVLALGFGLCKGWRRYLHLLGAVGNAGLFAWWWDQAPEAVGLICLAPLLLSVALLYRPTRWEGILFGIGAALLAGTLLIAMPEALPGALQSAREVLVHGLKGATAGFPDASRAVVELGPVQWGDLVAGTTAFSATVLLGAVGLAWLGWTKPRQAAVALTVPLLLALSAFLFGQRLLIFWGPPVGIGLACLAIAAAGRFRLGVPASAVAAALLAVVPVAMHELFEPSPAPRVVSVMPAMPSIRAYTPENAVIWTSWTFGYPIMYFTGRRTIADGQSMSGERRVYVDIPLASGDPVFARNFMHFYIARGIAGVRRIHAAAGSAEAGLRWLRRHLGGDREQAARSLHELQAHAPEAVRCQSVDACRAFLFPADTPPLHLLLSHDMLSSGWFWYGTWDPAKASGEAAAIMPLFQIKQRGDALIVSDDLILDANTGGRLRMDAGGEVFNQPIRKMVVYDGRGLQETEYGHAHGFHFEWMTHNGFGVIATANIAESLFNQLFVRHTSNPALFRHVDVRSPAYSLWEVVAES